MESKAGRSGPIASELIATKERFIWSIVSVNFTPASIVSKQAQDGPLFSLDCFGTRVEHRA